MPTSGDALRPPLWYLAGRGVARQPLSRPPQPSARSPQAAASSPSEGRRAATSEALDKVFRESPCSPSPFLQTSTHCSVHTHLISSLKTPVTPPQHGPREPAIAALVRLFPPSSLSAPQFRGAVGRPCSLSPTSQFSMTCKHSNCLCSRIFFKVNTVNGLEDTDSISSSRKGKHTYCPL